jgi:HlyD family secretion protein
MKGKKKLIVVPILLGAAGLTYWLSSEPVGKEDPRLLASGTVEATEAHLGFQVPGRITSIAVREGDLVQEGMQLAELDRKEMLARREEARARIAAARSQLSELESGFRKEEISEAQAAVDAARVRLQDAERDVARTKTLFEGGAVSREAYDKAELAEQLAKSQLVQIEERLGLLETGFRQERIATQRAQLAQAEASLQVIDASLENMLLVAAFDGVLTVRHREPGETVPAGQAVLTVMNREDRWVRIYVREDRIGAVKHGTSAEITTDTYPNKTYSGRVVFIASEAEFTPKSVQTTEERVRLVYAVKVQITSDPDYDLKPGMPADVRLEVDET